MSKAKYTSQPKAARDELFEAFLQESISSTESSFDTHKMSRYRRTNGRFGLSGITDDSGDDDDDDDNDDDDDDDSPAVPRRSFLKSDRIRSNNNNLSSQQLTMTNKLTEELRVSKDSLEEESLSQPVENGKMSEVPCLTLDAVDTSCSRDTGSFAAVNGQVSIHPGKETLDELADKEQFFQEMKKDCKATMDYGRLLRDIDESAPEALMMKAACDHQTPTEYGNAQSDVITGPGSAQQPTHALVEQSRNMLSQVSLLDSLDSTLENDKKPHTVQRTSGDMHTIPELTGERGTATRADSEEVRSGDNSSGPENDDVAVDSNRRPSATQIGFTLPNDNDVNSIHSANVSAKDTASKTVSGLAYTDTSRDVEAIYREMRKLGVTSGTTTEFTLRDTSGPGSATGTGSRQASVTELDNEPKTAANYRSDVALNRVELLPTDLADDSMTGKQKKTNSQTNDAQIPSVRFNEQTQEYSRSDTPRSEQDDASLIDEHADRQLTEDARVSSVNRAQVEPKSGSQMEPKSRSVPSGNSASGRPASVPQYDTRPALPRDTHLPMDRRPRDKYAGVRSSGYSRRSPPSRLTASQSAYSPAVKQRTGSGDSGHVKTTAAGLWDSRELESVKSIAGFVSSFLSEADKFELAQMISSADKPLMSSSPARNDVHDLQQQLLLERKTSTKLRAAMLAMEKDHADELARLKNASDKELLKVQQEKYVLSVQLGTQSETEKRLQTLAAMKQTDAASHEQLSRLEEDIRQQDVILGGYEKDNEQLRSEMKQLRATNKANEERMFHENRKLKTEIANLREEVQSYKDARLTYQNNDRTSAALGASRIAQLEAELRDAKGQERTRDQEALQATSQLQQEINGLRSQLSNLEVQLSSAQNQHSQHTQCIGEQHKKEIEGLQKKLKWYAENQQLVDKDAALLKQKDSEIADLAEKLRQLRSDAGQKQLQVKTSQNERTSQAKRIQDLERQVKEMENIIRKRHPNSLPAVIWAAASVPDDAVSKPPSVEYLEGRIRKLECDIELKDEEAKRSMRALQQKHNSMKLRYEERIQELETQNVRLQRDVDELTSSSRPHSNQLAVQRELDSVKERHQKQVLDLEQTINGLRQQLLRLRAKELANDKAESKPTSTEQDGSVRVDETEVLMAKTAADQTETKHQLPVNQRRPQGKSPGAVEACQKVPKGPKKTAPNMKKNSNSVAAEQLSRLPVEKSLDKHYVPDVFTGQHVTELVAENAALKNKLESAELEREQQRVELQKLAAEAEASERCLREEMEEKLSALTSAHQRQLQQIYTARAVEQSASKMAELQSKVSTQEVIISHLKQQLADAKVDTEHLAALGVTKVALEEQVKKLTDELCKAKSAHTPQMRHYEALQEKIAVMETRRQMREQQLQQLVQQQSISPAHDVTKEMSRWRTLVDEKNREIDRFRAELDAILEILRQLQSEGVVIPYSGGVPTVNYSLNDDRFTGRT